ncbi:uncharacterized protein ACIB01_016934 [Guaruba guarouba]
MEAQDIEVVHFHFDSAALPATGSSSSRRSIKCLLRMLSDCSLSFICKSPCLLLLHIETSCLRVAAPPELCCSARWTSCLKHLGFYLLWKVC